MRDDQLYWNTRIVVGKPNLATPIMSATMKFITVNPTWNVPPSIIANEYLPALRSDPDALTRIGLKIEQNRDGTVRIYQPPGDANALGRIRFNFPNKFLVYQHDTPDKHLFAHDKRAYSHGCMRVQDPLMYGEKLLSIVLPKEKYTAERLRRMFGGSEINIDFPVHIPVHLTYQTAYVDDAGKLVIRDDIYGRDAAPDRDPEGRRAPRRRYRRRSRADRLGHHPRCAALQRAGRVHQSVRRLVRASWRGAAAAPTAGGARTRGRPAREQRSRSGKSRASSSGFSANSQRHRAIGTAR